MLAHPERGYRRIVMPPRRLIIDIETTSLSFVNGHILQIGFLLRDGDILMHDSLYLRAPEPALVEYENGSYVQRMKAAGNTGYVKADDVRSAGLPPETVFTFLREAMRVCCAHSGVVAGHNLAGFDIPYIEYQSRKYDVPIEFDRTRVVDTGAIVKAMKLRRIPRDDETDWEFYCRVRDTVAKGVFWNLTTAIDEFRLREKVAMTGEAAHSAHADVFMTDCVYEHIRSLTSDDGQ